MDTVWKLPICQKTFEFVLSIQNQFISHPKLSGIVCDAIRIGDKSCTHQNPRHATPWTTWTTVDTDQAPHYPPKNGLNWHLVASFNRLERHECSFYGFLVYQKWGWFWQSIYGNIEDGLLLGLLYQLKHYIIIYIHWILSFQTGKEKLAYLTTTRRCMDLAEFIIREWHVLNYHGVWIIRMFMGLYVQCWVQNWEWTWVN